VSRVALGGDRPQFYPNAAARSTDKTGEARLLHVRMARPIQAGYVRPVTPTLSNPELMG